MPEKVNFHFHSTGSDGKLSPEEVVELAIKLNFKHICFTDHSCTPNTEDIIKPFLNNHSKEYLEEFRKVKEKFGKKIKIYLGIELNWLEDYVEWTKNETAKGSYDFILGSVHHLKNKDGKYAELMFPEEDFQIFVKQFGIKKLISEYYEQTRKMAKSGLFDSIGHFDLIKMYNKDSKYFDENSDFYRKEIIKTLEEIKKSGICIEINTSGFRRIRDEQYPSLWILKEMKKMEIPITLGSDGHKEEQFDFGLERGILVAKEAGYDSVLIFEKRKPVRIEL